MLIRLQKRLAMAGAASRRKAEEMITEGRVTVNGETVRTLGIKCSPSDIITVDGKPVKQEKKVYIMLHKPKGVLTTVRDPFGRPTVMDNMPGDVRLFPVGRLDFDTSGIIFLTNDGEWAHALAHPGHEVKKAYIAVLKGIPADDKLRAFRSGIEIEGRRTAPCEIKAMGNSRFCITIHEGRNQQIRKMCEAIGHPVIKLHRISIGGIRLGDLPQGAWRHLTKTEVESCMGKS